MIIQREMAAEIEIHLLYVGGKYCYNHKEYKKKPAAYTKEHVGTDAFGKFFEIVKGKLSFIFQTDHNQFTEFLLTLYTIQIYLPILCMHVYTTEGGMSIKKALH